MRPSWDAGLGAWREWANVCGVDPAGVSRGQLRRRLWHSVPAGQAAAIPSPAPAGDRPAGNASSDEWAAHAAAEGVDPAGLTRNEIRDLFAH